MRWLKKAVSGFIIISLMFPAQAQAKKYDPERSHKQFRGVLVDAYYLNLAHCETGLTKAKTPRWDYQSKSYTGAFGIARGTWQRWSNSSSAKGKSPRYQVAVADNIAFLGFTESDGTFRYPVGAFGWGSVKHNCRGLQGYLCRSKHKEVIKRRRNC